MKQYAKIINEETKEVQIGAGNTEQYYSEIGMSLKDVEQGYNGLWYLKGYAPKPTTEDEKEKVRAIRGLYLQSTDWTQLSDVSISTDLKKQYKEYRKYLRDYTDKEEWWLENPLTFEDWQKTIDF